MALVADYIDAAILLFSCVQTHTNQPNYLFPSNAVMVCECVSARAFIEAFVRIQGIHIRSTDSLSEPNSFNTYRISVNKSLKNSDVIILLFDYKLR